MSLTTGDIICIVILLTFGLFAVVLVLIVWSVKFNDRKKIDDPEKEGCKTTESPHNTKSKVADVPIIPVAKLPIVDSDGNLIISFDNGLQSIISLSNDPLYSIRTNDHDVGDSLTYHIKNLPTGHNAIRKVRDPFLQRFISIGSVACVIKPFKGMDSKEFSVLHPGDLIRIIGFFVKIPKIYCKKITLLKSGLQQEDIEPLSIPSIHSEVDDEIVLDKHNPQYEFIYCTGILLNTHLEAIPGSTRLNLQVNDEINDDVLNDFPLSIISLETTVVENAQ